MEGQGLGGNEDSISAIKEIRQQLESRMDTLHTTQLDLIASLQSLVPDFVSSLDLSLKVIFGINDKLFTPLAQIIPSKLNLSKAHVSKFPLENSKVSCSTALSRPSPRESERVLVEENGGRSALVDEIVAERLLMLARSGNGFCISSSSTDANYASIVGSMEGNHSAAAFDTKKDQEPSYSVNPATIMASSSAADRSTTVDESCNTTTTSPTTIGPKNSHQFNVCEYHNFGKLTMNVGCVKSSSYTNDDNDFYRIIEEIIQLTYSRIPLHVVLLKYRLIDPLRGMKGIGTSRTQYSKTDIEEDEDDKDNFEDYDEYKAS
ncbi:UNVERIFIED_CONTAM: N6-adenosine-methyltransferase MT-A70-like protein [Sesamum indicum]